MFDPQLFKDKTVVITGAGRGIGLEVARQFLAGGANIIAHLGRERTPDLADFLLEAEASRRAFLAHGNFLDTGHIESFAAQVAERYPSLDVLINNAGTMVGRFPADQLTNTDYEAVVMLNQTSVVYLTRALIPLLRKAGEAAIVNTVSISALTGGSPGSAIYSAAKAFVAAYSKALARELAPDNIRVNCVSPGTITTDFHGRYSAPEKLEATRRTIPLQRLGTPKDCAPAYLFLASPHLSGYITGQVIEVNGGQLIC